MVDGQLNKTGVIIQARMGSSRLPGKVLMPFPFGTGTPLLELIVKKIGRIFDSEQIYVATTAHQRDDAIATLCSHLNINCFRGSEDDVLSRFTAIAEKHPEWNHITRFTADNPLISIPELKLFLGEFFVSDKQYCYTNGLPLGMNFEIVDKDLLLSLKKETLKESDREHVTSFIRNNLPNKCMKFSFDIKVALRCTIDYPEDFLVLSAIQTVIEHNNDCSDLEVVLEHYEKNKWLFSINENLKQLS